MEEFTGRDLRGAHFVECNLSGAVLRGVEVSGLDLDAPWLPHGDGLLVNGVDVTGYVEAELDRRFPGRALRTAEDADGLRAAWAAVEAAWATALGRAAELPPGAVDRSVAGEWSWAQTLRHLVYATDLWFGRSVLGREELHPLGLRYDTRDPGDPPPYAEVLVVRADRVAGVRGFLATVTEAQLDEERPHPRDPAHPETVRSCLHTVLEEEWEHLRFAVRDLDALSRAERQST